jgi:hypothetical protein
MAWFSGELLQTASAMRNITVILLTSVLLASCSSSGDLVEGSEDYTGRPAAAVAPVADRRPGSDPNDHRRHADIQHSIQRQLDQSGMFAGVVTLDQPDEGNEAEVIIEPALVGSGGDLGLKVRVTEKTRRTTVLDETYEGSGGGGGTLTVAVAELEEDLERRYGR